MSTTTIDEKIAKATERATKMSAYADQLRRIATAEAEIPAAYRTGEVSKQKLAEQYGISSMTVSRILSDNGIAGATVRRLTDEEKREVVALIRAEEPLDAIAEAFSVSRNSIRTVGLKAGVLKPGQRKPHRSDEEYAQIAAFDEEARARFGGAGLYNLGMGLKTWQARRKAAAAGEPVPAEELVEDETVANFEDTGETSENEALAHGDVSHGGTPEPPHTESDPEPSAPRGSALEGDFRV